MNRLAILLLFVGLAAGTVFGYVLRPRTAVRAEHDALATAPPAPAPSGERRVLYWFDPMQPNQHFDKPGKSPYMDMPLRPKYADETGSDGGAVAISAGIVANLGVRTAQAERGSLARTLHAAGNVGYDENSVEVVQARVAGYVAHLYVRAPLARVRRGQALLDLVAPDWAAAQEEYLALRRASADPTLRDAARRRLAVLGMSEDQVRAIERSGSARSTITLTARIDGVVGESNARDGMAVMPGTPLFRINGLDHVWITADVAENRAALLREGAAATVTVPAWPGRTFEGTVNAVLPNVAQATRTQAVRIDVANGDGALAPGMYASVELALPTSELHLLVPSEAIIRTGTRAVVILAERDGTFRPAEVTLGAEEQGKTEILAGLDQGERVVLSGQFLIDSEASLRATVARMQGAREATP